MGPLIPLFRTSGDFCPGFQSQGGFLACTLSCLRASLSSGSVHENESLTFSTAHFLTVKMFSISFYLFLMKNNSDENNINQTNRN